MTSGVYAIVNKKNGSQYIGSSFEIENRWKRHVAKLRKGDHHSPHLQHAWDLYREDAFDFVVLVECDPDFLLDQEQQLIDAQKPAYNVSPTAGRVTGIVRSEEYRQKQCQSQKGKSLSEETRKRISKGMKGKRNSLGVTHDTADSTKEKIRATLLGHPVSDETKQKLSAKNRNYRHTEEAKERISASLIGNKRAAKKSEQATA